MRILTYLLNPTKDTIRDWNINFTNRNPHTSLDGFIIYLKEDWNIADQHFDNHADLLGYNQIDLDENHKNRIHDNCLIDDYIDKTGDLKEDTPNPIPWDQIYLIAAMELTPAEKKLI